MSALTVLSAAPAAPLGAPPDEQGPTPGRRIVGNYRVWPAFPSARLALPRDVVIWLPPDYDARPGHRFPVLYMHDGQQVFDPSTSTWNQDWRVDDVAQELIPAGKMESCIVVAPYCTPDRAAEYDPFRLGPDYLAFLVDELKPRIDAAFRTDPTRNAVTGSSMGGLVSFYILFARPDLFQAAAAVSPAFLWRFDHWQEKLRTLSAAGNLPSARLFLSCGDAGELEQRLLKGTREMEALLREVRYPGPLLVRYPSGEEHNEAAWSRLVPELLPFLYPPTPAP